MSSEEYNPKLSEILQKSSIIMAVCAHGNSRSKVIARALDNLGYYKSRAVGWKSLKENTLDPDLMDDFAKAPVIVCADGEVEAELRNFEDGDLIKGKIIVNLHLSEKDHSKASGNMGNEARDELQKEIVRQLEAEGF